MYAAGHFSRVARRNGTRGGGSMGGGEGIKQVGQPTILLNSTAAPRYGRAAKYQRKGRTRHHARQTAKRKDSTRVRGDIKERGFPYKELGRKE